MFSIMFVCAMVSVIYYINHITRINIAQNCKKNNARYLQLKIFAVYLYHKNNKQRTGANVGKTLKTTTMKTIKFGILVNLNLNNRHYLQAYDRLQEMITIDAYNYLKPFDRRGYSNNEEMIYDYVNMFADDAKWIKSLDGEGYKSSFFVVCYIAGKTGVKGIEPIKEIFK